jgi:hypothetical protein
MNSKKLTKVIANLYEIMNALEQTGQSAGEINGLEKHIYNARVEILHSIHQIKIHLEGEESIDGEGRV